MYEYEYEAPPIREEKHFVHQPIETPIYSTPAPKPITVIESRPIEIVEKPVRYTESRPIEVIETPYLRQSTGHYEKVVVRNDSSKLLSNARYHGGSRMSGIHSVILDNDPVYVCYNTKRGRKYYDVMPAAKVVELDGEATRGGREKHRVGRSGHYETSAIDPSTSNYFFGRQDYDSNRG